MSFVAMVVAAAAVQTGAAQPVDWAATLRKDAQAMHDDIAANHPGPVNTLDPGFSHRNDAALAQVDKRAKKVTDFAGYAFAMRAYVAAFDDGHMGLRITDMDKMPMRWPGFLTAFDDQGRQVVRTRVAGAPVPLGAVLKACDGRPADRLAAENVGTFWGRWFLGSMRHRQGWKLFVDYGNPFIALPRRCTFSVSGTQKTVTLNWREFAGKEAEKAQNQVAQRARPPIGSHVLADGTRWYNLSDFNGDPKGAAAKALVPLIAQMRANREAILTAPRIVLDLRGNNGGSSDWSYQIAQILWGKARVAAVNTGGDVVDWRASADNLETLRKYQKQFSASPNSSAEMKAFFARVVDGMTAARQAGKSLYREIDPEAAGAGDAAKTADKPRAPSGTVYFITDNMCASACLDAADLWLALGAIQLGKETSADTLYMDVRQDKLPSGLATLSVPMKVYRGRVRGSNVPLTPRYRYPGSLSDTAALQKWVLALKPEAASGK